MLIVQHFLRQQHVHCEQPLGDSQHFLLKQTYVRQMYVRTKIVRQNPLAFQCLSLGGMGGGAIYLEPSS